MLQRRDLVGGEESLGRSDGGGKAYLATEGVPVMGETVPDVLVS